MCIEHATLSTWMATEWRACVRLLQVPAFGKDVMYTPGAAEYALLACQVDGDGRTVSGQNRPLTCKVGELV